MTAVNTTGSTLRVRGPLKAYGTTVEILEWCRHGPAALILSVWMVGRLLLCQRTFRWRRRGDG